MGPVFANAVNLQQDCPLFSKIPKEIRDIIFDLVTTPHYGKHSRHNYAIRYHGPGFRYACRSLSTTLLRCCQLIYSETCHLPAKKYVQVDWTTLGIKGKCLKDEDHRSCFPTALQNLHLFTTGYWLEDRIEKTWIPYTRAVATQVSDLKRLKITLDHDNWLQGANSDLVPNPKKMV